jgi:hypothetical protein
LGALQELADSLNGSLPRLPTITQIKDKSRIAHDFASESGGRDFGAAQEFLNVSQ